jgi:hypothetical protein
VQLMHKFVQQYRVKFHYCMNFGAKPPELVQLIHKFVPRSCIAIFRNDRTGSTPLDPKLIFWGISHRFVTTRKSLQNGLNWCSYDAQVCATKSRWNFSQMFGGVSDHFVAARTSMQNGLNWCNSCTSSCHDVALEFFA